MSTTSPCARSATTRTSACISPERRGTARIFHSRDRIRLALILRGRRLGFSLDEIATIVNMYDAEPGEAGQLRYLIEQIGVRRATSSSAAATSTRRSPTSTRSSGAATTTSDDSATEPSSSRPRRSGDQAVTTMVFTIMSANV